MDDQPIVLKRIHAQRLREVYRSTGWPYQDVVEIDLLAAGLLERVVSATGHPLWCVSQTLALGIWPGQLRETARRARRTRIWWKRWSNRCCAMVGLPGRG